MKKINFKPLLYLAFNIIIILGVGCKQEVLNKPVVTNTNPPGVVSNVSVVNLNGKAKLTYTLPGDKDLLYVKAVYETSPGHSLEVVASHYTNTLTVEGFGDTLSHTVKLFAVNSSEVASAPVSVTVNPLTPTFNLAFRTLNVIASFGGFYLTCNNPTLENLVIIPMVDTAGKGVWIQTVGMDNIYSNSPVIQKSIRNQPAITRKYAFVVRDRWLNHSDTLFLTLTPIFEQMLPKSAWSNYKLPGDAVTLYSYTTVDKIWNGNYNQVWPNVLFTVENASTPQTITIDLGAAHVLSRFKMNPFLEIGNAYFTRGNLKDFEVWGSNNPNLSGAYDNSWTLMGTYHVIKPSGSPNGTETTADYNYGHDGWDFDFSAGIPAYRYIRIRSLANWTGSYFMSMSQFTLWGN